MNMNRNRIRNRVICQARVNSYQMYCGLQLMQFLVKRLIMKNQMMGNNYMIFIIDNICTKLILGSIIGIYKIRMSQ